MKTKVKILFICHGNICRSVAAEFIFKDMIKKAGREEEFHIESAATSTEEIGNGVYPSMRRILNANGIECNGHSAKQMKKTDYDKFDYLVGMDKENLRNMVKIAGGDPLKKIFGLFEYVDKECTGIEDPWYTGNFERVYGQIMEGCTNLLLYLDERCRY